MSQSTTRHVLDDLERAADARAVGPERARSGSAAGRPGSGPCTTEPALTSLASASQISATLATAGGAAGSALSHGVSAPPAGCGCRARPRCRARLEQLVRGRVHGGHGRAGEERQQHRAGDQGRGGAQGRRVAARAGRDAPGRGRPRISRTPRCRRGRSRSSRAGCRPAPPPTARASAGLWVSGLQDQQLADEARQRRQADRGDGGEEEQAGQQVELAEGRGRRPAGRRRRRGGGRRGRRAGTARHRRACCGPGSRERRTPRSR